jgi:hypothetical protein
MKAIDLGDWSYLGSHVALDMTGGDIFDMDIYENHFKGWGYGSIGIWTWNTNPQGKGLAGIHVHNNTFDQLNQNYGRAFMCYHQKDYLDKDNPVKFYNNYVKDQAVHSQIGCSWIEIFNNIFDGVHGADGDIKSDAASAITITGYSGYGGMPSYKNKIYNNIFTRCGRSGISFTLWYDLDTEDLEIINNIFYNNGYDERWRQILIYGSKRADFINPRFENNLFWADEKQDIIWAMGKFMNVTTFNALNGSQQDLNPVGNIQANPLFVNPKNGNFRLRAGSPAIGAGINVGLINDHDGKQFKSTPSIGPYEYYP